MSRWPEEGRPFFVDGVGELHTALNRFFSSARMRNRSAGTNKKYAYALGIWVNFLAQQALSWDDATDEEVLEFKFWRMTDSRNPRPVTGTTWSGDLAALITFYDWANRHLQGPALELGAPHSRSQSWSRPPQSPAPSYRPATVRTADVRWLSPGAFRLWRDLGMHGFTKEGRELVRWRPRSQARDAAFVEGLYSTGLRVQEWSSVLTLELLEPSPDQKYVTQRLASACAKRGHGRPYWIGSDAIDSIATYVETERAQAIERARSDGTYERLTDVLIATTTDREGQLRVSRRGSTHSQMVRIDTIRPAERLRLFRETTNGLQPLQLSLNENGLPRPKRAWYKSFERANARVRKSGVENLQCTPHMLRHSFALRWYAVARLIWERRWRTEQDAYVSDFREQFGDSWTFVQTMLGHADVTTTRSIYLEPFRAMDVRALLEYGRADLDPETLVQVLKDDARVRLLSLEEKGSLR